MAGEEFTIVLCSCSTGQEEPSVSWADRMDDLEASEIDPSERREGVVCWDHYSLQITCLRKWSRQVEMPRLWFPTRWRKRRSRRCGRSLVDIRSMCACVGDESVSY